MKPPSGKDAARFRILDHTADYAVEAIATNERDLISNSIEALFSAILQNFHFTGTATKTVTFTRELSFEDFLFDILREILYFFYSTGTIPSGLEYDGRKLEVRFSPWDPAVMPVNMEVKAVTRHRFRVGKRRNSFFAVMVFDV